MKTFKKLFLSATTILMTTGAVDTAQAFVFLRARNELYNGSQQQNPQQATNLQTITPEITAKNQGHQIDHPILTALPTASHQQSLAQFEDPESQDAFSLLIRHLAPVFTVQKQGNTTPEETRKFRTQLIDLAQKFKATHEAPQNIAPLQEKADDKHQGLIEEIRALKEGIRQLQEAMIAKPQELQVRAEPQALMIDAADDRVILSREEFSRLTDQIGALTEQINQLQGNHQDLIGSVSALQVSYEEGHHNLSSGIPSSAFRSINASSEESSSSTEFATKEGVETTPNSSTTARGETLTNGSSPASDTDTPTGEEDTPHTALKSVTSTLPTDTETPISSSGLPEIAGDSQPALIPETWDKEKFEQAVLGMRPASLSAMDETETNLWRTFTVLRFAGQKENKPWTTWGGAFTTEELEDKFKDHAFMRNAFQVKKSLSFGGDDFTYFTFPDITGYFTSKTPDIRLESEKDADLIKAYYFRGLYRALTGDDWKVRSNGSMAAKFIVDSTTGIKGGRFNYGSDTLGMPSYESSIYDAEGYFQDTPWHSLFINKVNQAAINSLSIAAKESNELYQVKMLRLSQERHSACENLVSSFEDNDQIRKAISKADQITATIDLETKNRDLEMDLAKVKRMKVQGATSLRDIDEALGIL